MISPEKSLAPQTVTTRSKRSQKYALMFLALITTVAAAYWGIVFPIAQSQATVTTETKALQLKLEQYHSSLEMVNAYIQRRDSLNQRRTELSARLYARDDVLALIERLKQLAEENNASVREISPSVIELLAMNNAPLDDEAPQHVNIHLRVRGEAEQAGSLLKTLETEPYFVDLMSVHVVGRESGLVPAEFVLFFRAQLGALPVNTQLSRAAR